MGQALKRDHSDQWGSGTRAIDDTIETARYGLRDMGLEDGALMESIVVQKRSAMQEESSRNIVDNYSEPYKNCRYLDEKEIQK